MPALIVTDGVENGQEHHYADYRCPGCEKTGLVPRARVERASEEGSTLVCLDCHEPTFELTASTVTAERFAQLLSGLSQQVMMYDRLGAPSVARKASTFLMDIVRENPELARHTLLDAETADHIGVQSLPDDVLDELEIEVVNGQLMDARNMTSIEVEGGDDGAE